MDRWALTFTLISIAGLIALILAALEQLDPFGRGETLRSIGLLLVVVGAAGLIAWWAA